MDIKGKIIQKLDLQSGTSKAGNQWKKQEYVLETFDSYPKKVKFDFFDADFNHLPFTQGHPNAKQLPEKPKGFEEMKRLAAQLSKGLPEVRVDFYDVNGHIYFGEFTFFHFGGMVKFNPVEWDYKFGEWIKLPIKNK